MAAPSTPVRIPEGWHLAGSHARTCQRVATADCTLVCVQLSLVSRVCTVCAAGADEPCLRFQHTPSCPKGLFHPSPKCNDGSGEWKDEATVLSQGVYIVQLSGRMAMEIMRYGPITASMGVYADFLNYTSGVYKQQSDTPVGAHAVKIIGWGVDPAQGGYWLVQNSWTTRWGEGGYFRIAMAFGEDDPCECDICNMGVSGMFFGNHSDLHAPA